jgi:hypothetical protein
MLLLLLPHGKEDTCMESAVFRDQAAGCNYKAWKTAVFTLLRTLTFVKCFCTRVSLQKCKTACQLCLLYLECASKACA